jgi:hypothetical protein
MSLLFCEAFPEEFPMFDTFFIVHTLVQKAITNGIDIRKEFAKFDSNHSGVCLCFCIFVTPVL